MVGENGIVVCVVVVVLPTKASTEKIIWVFHDIITNMKENSAIGIILHIFVAFVFVLVVIAVRVDIIPWFRKLLWEQEQNDDDDVFIDLGCFVKNPFV